MENYYSRQIIYLNVLYLLLEDGSMGACWEITALSSTAVSVLVSVVFVAVASVFLVPILIS